MALFALDGDPGVQRAAPPDLDHVAQLLRRGGFADNAGVDDLALGRQGLDHPFGAVQRRAFLVAGDQEGEGAGGFTVRQHLGNGGDPGGDPALHVHRAATVQDAVPDLGVEGLGGPLIRGAGRDHIRMAGETQVGRGGPAPGVQILDPRMDAFAARSLEGQAAAGEAQGRQMPFQHIHRPLVGGRDGGNADQVAGQFDRIDNGS